MNQKYQIDTAENKAFLKDVRNGLLSFGHRFPSPGGGSYYHIDQNCKSTAPKWLPFDGQFTFSQINEGDYAKLTPCAECGAPLRVY